ncbi:hypothetical protein DHEL01_v207521 [Diaporthe helianthi]|uniref:Uncharacterized protein n=1 Tax=Diaporthe helianthi TaxID=158607 RepID=A0A2P5HUY8_DIAHE|nr:hypothetical protein DHEL01_v207521 [Diaporthe helianthi]
MADDITKRQSFINSVYLSENLIHPWTNAAMRIVTRTRVSLQSTSHGYLEVRPFHHTFTASSSSAQSIHSQEEGQGSENQHTATPKPDPKAPQNSEKNSESSFAPKILTVAEMDEELRLKLEAMSGEGGASGIEYEGGKAEGLKRGVKSNMFRVI